MSDGPKLINRVAFPAAPRAVVVPVSLAMLVISMLGGCEQKLTVTPAGGGVGDSGSAGGPGGGLDVDFTIRDGGFVEGGPSRGRSCKVESAEMDGLICTKHAPAMAFSPKLKWSWSPPKPVGLPYYWRAMTTPLVANLTDDNGDGAIDLCDVPDVVVWTDPRQYILAGNTGQVEYEFSADSEPPRMEIPRGSNSHLYVTPAIGDIDGDGIPEIVAYTYTRKLLVYDNKGKIKLVGDNDGAPMDVPPRDVCAALAIYDLDADGTPEIIGAFSVFDNKGHLKFRHDLGEWATMTTAKEEDYWCPTSTAADLDGDGKLEVIFGNAAYHADGTVYWTLPGPPGHPQVANLDADPDPEILLARMDGILVLEHDGKVKFGPIRMIDEPISDRCWGKPAAVHDFDGDGIADISASTCYSYGIYGVGPTGLSLKWMFKVDDKSGLASSTAFDFLGRGVAQGLYADQIALYVMDGKTGAIDLTQKRHSGTLIEYPVVADVDNDGSADIVVVSDSPDTADQAAVPAVQVFEDAEKRWIPTRRIWNQHAYHVTNVREDGTIPRVMAKHWLGLNTFRTNAQLEGGATCDAPLIE